MPNIREPFVLGYFEGTIAYAYWQPGFDPDTVATELLNLSNSTRDWTVPLQIAKEIAIKDTVSHFNLESDPERNPWEPLNSGYLEEKTKAGFPPDILYRTGKMFDVATSEEAWQVEEKNIVFHAEMLPFYGPYHQTGFPKLPGAPGLPQREFIGISDKAADEIEYVFGKWLDELVEEDLGDGGSVGGGELPGDYVWTTKGFGGVLTAIPAFGGGFLVRGRGSFVKGVFHIT